METEDPAGNRVTLEYDAENRLVRRTARTASGTVGPAWESFSYGPLGELLEARDSDGNAVAFSYDGFGRKEAETQNGKTVSYAYGNDGRISSETLPSGRVLDYARDALGRPTGMAEGSGQSARTLAQYQYSGPFPSGTLLGNGTAESRLYQNGRPAALALSVPGSQAPLRAYSYAYDRNSNPLSDGEGGYAYDALSRLSSAGYGTESESFAYDRAGNRTVRTSTGTETGTADYARNPLDQYPEIARTLSGGTQTGSYRFDPNGNLVETDRLVLEYDWHSRLRKVTEKEWTETGSLGPRIPEAYFLGSETGSGSETGTGTGTGSGAEPPPDSGSGSGTGTGETSTGTVLPPDTGT